MRRLVSIWMGQLAMVAVLGLALLSPAAAAEEAPAPAPGTTGASIEPRPAHRQPERLTHKPSGFWTSNRPSQGGAYKYRLLGIGLVLVVITGIGTVWVVRKHSRPAQ